MVLFWIQQGTHVITLQLHCKVSGKGFTDSNIWAPHLKKNNTREAEETACNLIKTLTKKKKKRQGNVWVANKEIQAPAPKCVCVCVVNGCAEIICANTRVEKEHLFLWVCVCWHVISTKNFRPRQSTCSLTLFPPSGAAPSDFKAQQMDTFPLSSCSPLSAGWK